MTIWILAILLLASLTAIGYRQGAIRAAFSLGGILMGALLAVPIGHLLKPLFGLVVKNPLLLWVLPPFLVFVLILTAFKIGGLTVHKKAENYYKYKVRQLHCAMWERLNARLGLCVGAANGVAYLTLLSFVIYAFSYWTVQISAADSEAKSVQLMNRLGKDAVRTGLARVARAIDGLPATYYDAADIAGLIYHNPLLQTRISRYPGFLALGERQEFQDLANDTEFHTAWESQTSLREMLNHPRVQAILGNPELVGGLWAALAADAADFRSFLETGLSAKYDAERILGRWTFDVTGAMSLVRRARPNLSATELVRLRRSLASYALSGTTFIAAPDKQAILKNIPRVVAGPPPSIEQQTLRGQWKNDGGKYQVALNIDGQVQELAATFEGSRLTMSGAGLELAFARAD